MPNAKSTVKKHSKLADITAAQMVTIFLFDSTPNRMNMGNMAIT